jgi:hypothetical protein
MIHFCLSLVNHDMPHSRAAAATLLLMITVTGEEKLCRCATSEEEVQEGDLQEGGPQPLQIFLLDGQSNMVGLASFNHL